MSSTWVGHGDDDGRPHLANPIKNFVEDDDFVVRQALEDVLEKQQTRPIHQLDSQIDLLLQKQIDWLVSGSDSIVGFSLNADETDQFV